MKRPVEFDQVQGILRFGYQKLTECSFFLLALKDVVAARAWLASAPVSIAVTRATAPESALQVAFTCSGLRSLGCAEDLLAQFSPEFQAGMASEARARLLGDTGGSAPGNWEWGADNTSVDLLVMLYAQPGKLAGWMNTLLTPLWEEAFSILKELTTSDLDGVEPFGFRDGLSQPELDWKRERVAPSVEDTYTNRIALGEFLLGYPNEYDKYTERPVLPEDRQGAHLLPMAEDQVGKRDLGRNGSYLVLRTLQQDVQGFWAYVRSRAANNEAAEKLAAAMVGRNKDGTPLAAADLTTVPGANPADTLNRFTFSSDPDAVRCPFGAHIRRANPRNGDLPSPNVTGLSRLLALLGLQQKTLHSDSKAASRFHRVLRRGREYSYPSTENGQAGLHFMCLAANIARQFEFLQSAWIMSTKFDALTDESDPLLGSREFLQGAPATDTYSIPRENTAPNRLRGIPRFVAVRGGSYFFLPSLPALCYLTRHQ